MTIITIGASLNFAFIATAAEIELHDMKDCSDAISEAIAKDVAGQVEFGLKNVSGAMSVSVGNCAPMWSTKMLGGAIAGAFYPNTCGAKIKFDSRNSAKNFAGYAKIFGSRRSMITWMEFKGYRANVDVCGEDAVSY